MTNKASQIKFYHHPHSRSVSIRWLLEELAADYDVVATLPSQVGEEYRKIQPHKKVPAIVDGSTIVTERAAIALYLAERFPSARLAPSIDDPIRADYLSMLVYVDAVFDPCVSAHHHGLTYASSDYSFGTYDDLVRNLENKLTQRPYAAGDRFTAADTQLGSALGFTMYVLDAVPHLPVFVDYLDRLRDRPAHLRAQELDQSLARELGLLGAEPGENPAVAMNASS